MSAPRGAQVKNSRAPLPTALPEKLRFEVRHNMIALLDERMKEATMFLPMVEFLQRSSVFHALTANPVIHYDLVNEFWRTAIHHCDTTPKSIRATVQGTEIIITDEVIRRVLDFNDSAQAKIEYDFELLHGCFRRMGYLGDLRSDTFNKACLPPIWRFLAHTLISCFSSRKSGFDSCNTLIQSAIVGLVLNKPFNFTRFVFNALKGNIDEGFGRFILFPRYIQLLLDDLAPKLAKTGDKVRPNMMQKRVYADCKLYKNRPKPDDTPLFGHVLNVNYKAPTNDNRYHPEEQADLEQPQAVPPPPGNQPPLPPPTQPVPVLEDAEVDDQPLIRKSSKRPRDAPTSSSAPTAKPSSKIPKTSKPADVSSSRPSQSQSKPKPKSTPTPAPKPLTSKPTSSSQPTYAPKPSIDSSSRQPTQPKPPTPPKHCSQPTQPAQSSAFASGPSTADLYAIIQKLEKKVDSMDTIIKAQHVEIDDLRHRLKATDDRVVSVRDRVDDLYDDFVALSTSVLGEKVDDKENDFGNSGIDEGNESDNLTMELLTSETNQEDKVDEQEKTESMDVDDDKPDAEAEEQVKKDEDEKDDDKKEKKDDMDENLTN